MIKFISYDGEYPSLCRGDLILEVNGEKRYLGSILQSGGFVLADADYNFTIASGEWYVDKEDWPEDFDRGMQLEALEVINNNVQHGCCGGCA